MRPEQELLSNLTTFSKYARFWGELGRRENYSEIVARNRQMHLDHIAYLNKDSEELRNLIDDAYKLVAARKIFPSMRSYQFGGEPIHRNNTRIYNCAFRYADEPSFFYELMYLLLGGTGVGYSVQKQHVASLPAITKPGPREVFRIPDDIEGWSLAVDTLFNAYLAGGPEPIFDYSLIRPEGSILRTSGGRAPGPEPLGKTLNQLHDFLAMKEPGDKLRPIEVHDMATIIARAVLSGGIRRSAMISLFSPDDEEMLNAKSSNIFAKLVYSSLPDDDGRVSTILLVGDRSYEVSFDQDEWSAYLEHRTVGWWKIHPERAFANNSAVLLRGRDDELFFEVFRRARESGSGEPGIFWVDDPKYGTNPCAEITLNNKQFCNLTTIDVGTVEDQDDLNRRAAAAAVIGTLQASYTDFPFLSRGWEEQTRAEALLGVSMTGVASGAIDDLDVAEAAAHAVVTNIHVANLLGINAAARVTAIKPEGTASLVAGTSSGIHAWHDKIYVRRSRYNKGEPIAKYLMRKFPLGEPGSLSVLEQDAMAPNQVILSIPQMAPEGAVTRSEGALSMLERVKRYHRDWIRPGNEYGGMSNNISATVNVQDHEWDEVENWMWNNRYEYNGLSLMPYADHTYVQAPYETIGIEDYERLSAEIAAANIDLSEIIEIEDYTDLNGELACVGGACELPW